MAGCPHCPTKKHEAMSFLNHTDICCNHVDVDKVKVVPAPLIDERPVNENKSLNHGAWLSRHRCGCVKTSEKLKAALARFPSDPPMPPTRNVVYVNEAFAQRSNFMKPKGIIPKDLTGLRNYQYHSTKAKYKEDMEKERWIDEKKKVPENGKFWLILTEMVSIIQTAVTATALAVYYLIYCYMQVIYYTLSSAVYFHNADMAMKLTIATVTITALALSTYFLYQIKLLLGMGIHFRRDG